MKLLAKLLCLLLTCSAMLCLSSCGGDEPSLPEDEPSIIEKPEPEPEPELNPCKILRNVRQTYSLSSDNNWYTTNSYHLNEYEVNEWSGYTYVTSFTTSGNDPWLYSYNLPYSIQMSWGSFSLNLHLDEIYHFVEKQYKKGDEPEYLFTYDSKGRLANYTNSSGNRFVYTYDDNYNIVNYQKYKSDKLLEEWNIYYSEEKAKTVPVQIYFSGSFDFPGNYHINLYEAGFFGISIPINLISKIDVQSYYTNSSYELEYDYTFDNDGYISTATEHKYLNTNTFISIYTFEWEPSKVNTYTNWLFNDTHSPYYRLLNK